MHRGHDHHHHDFGGGGVLFGPGHNHAGAPQRVVQWQRPHLDAAQDHGADDHVEPDLDLVETAFVEGFAGAADPTSFLRLAQVPFEATAQDGARLALLRVEVDAVTDVGSVMPHLGGETFRYDPLPAKMVTRRRRLRFIYGDGRAAYALGFAEVRGLKAG
ncbi:MAG TPA: hypothetical protein VGG01_13115 [Xanthobacteraceae bacterium]|jgi:hypothetical protein